MKQFKIKQESFKEIRNKMLIKAIPISFLATFAGLAINYFNTKEKDVFVDILPIMIPLILGSLVIGIYIGLKRQKKILDSYILTIDNDGVTREQNNTPTITISNFEISDIVKKSNGNFTIKGNSSVNFIEVHSQIDDYEFLEKELFQPPK